MNERNLCNTGCVWEWWEDFIGAPVCVIVYGLVNGNQFVYPHTTSFEETHPGEYGVFSCAHPGLILATLMIGTSQKHRIRNTRHTSVHLFPGESHLQIIGAFNQILLFADMGEGAQCTSQPRRRHCPLMSWSGPHTGSLIKSCGQQTPVRLQLPFSMKAAYH